MAQALARPRVVISKCIEFAACRYDGTMISDEFVRCLKTRVDFVPVCPEMEVGLGCPRDPIRIVAAQGTVRLVQPTTGRDVSDAMREFSRKFLDGLGTVDGFLLKARSPSCGIRDVKIFGGPQDAEPQGLGRGFFGGAVLARFPDLAVEDEEGLARAAIRERFLEKLFAT